MSWSSQIGRLPEAEQGSHRCEHPECKIASAPYLARTDWMAMTTPPASSPRFRRFCVNHAAAFAALTKLPFPPGYWKEGKLSKPPQVFEIPEGTPMATCSSCRANVRWITTANGKKMPCDDDGVSHFVTCVNADRHRKR